MLERYGHGGDLTTAEALYGRRPEQFLDFSANMNPFGPPERVGRLLAKRWPELARYPDPAVRELREAIAEHYGVPASCVLVGNGAAELIDLSARWLGARSVGIARPAFSEYEEAVRKYGGHVVDIPLSAEDGFALRESDLLAAAERTDLLMIGHPNNPTGRLADPELLLRLVKRGKPIVVDEAFVDFVPHEREVSLIRQAAETAGLYVLRSMTKFFAIPGLRLGFMVARPEAIEQLRAMQVPWSVNAAAQWAGVAALGDTAYADKTRRWLAEERPWLTERLRRLGLKVYDSDVNFLLLRLPARTGMTAGELQQALGRAGVLIRDGSRFPGLDERYVRVAVRLRQDNVQLVEALAAVLEGSTGKFVPTVGESAPASGKSVSTPDEAGRTSPLHEAGENEVQAVGARRQPEGEAAEVRESDRLRVQRTGLSDAVGAEAEAEAECGSGGIEASAPRAPTLMVQGTSSDAGKSLLTTALCRILLQDGRRVAPFKSQNMSLNSYVTPDGKEIGRAQGMQADACRIAATTDMNPILLKPKKEMVSQVVVHGKPLRDYEARAYREQFLTQAQYIVLEALGRLRQRFDVVVIEGAGSPAEVNLKDRDIVNMRLAGWADAPVVLVADIDRGGVFASLVGTMEIFTPEERARVRGFIINKFRGDVTLLKPGLDWLEQRTGKPVLGVVPYLPELGLEDEDSASLDAKKPPAGPKRDGQVEVAVLRLPRLSNFTDFDPLFEEPDVFVRYVTSLSEWGEPDAVIIPGSKNTVDDLLALRERGLEERIRRHVEGGGRLLGICAGYQMMGMRLLDPDKLEADTESVEGLGLFPAETTFTPDKRTERVVGTMKVEQEPDDALEVDGYEIHMGRTAFHGPVRRPFLIRTHDAPDETSAYREDGAVSEDGKVLGTYVHGILHNDAFRRFWINGIRADKGWAPITGELQFRERREAAFDRLADHVRRHLDMEQIYAMIDGEWEGRRER